MSYVGTYYDLVQDDKALRALIVPMEVGDGPAYVTMEERARAVRSVRYGKRNPHMQGVVFALQLAFGLPLSGGQSKPKRTNEHLEINGERVHLLDAFAMANLRLCSVADAGKRSMATEIVSQNCWGHLASTIEILEPTLVISQGKTVHPTLGHRFDLDRPYRENEHVYRASLGGQEFVWAAFHHPTQWWHGLGCRYLWDTVEPGLKRARFLALHG